MSRAALVSLVFIVGAGVGALAVLTVADGPGGGADRVAELEEQLADARRDASDYERIAIVERERKELAEQEAADLRLLVSSAPAVAADPTTDPDGAHQPPTPARAEIPASEWDARRLRNELQRLTVSGQRMGSSPLVQQCADAVVAQGDEAFTRIVDVLRVDGLPPSYVRAATLILDRVGDPRAVPAILRRWEAEPDALVRRALLRALANLDGDEQVPILLSVWNNPEAEARMRLLAVHGLSLRAHPAAVALVSASNGPEGAAARARAVESLHAHARKGDYTETALIAAFGSGLATADGEGQVRLAILALEGFWHPDAAAALQTFADLPDQPPAIVSQQERARGIAAAISTGAPRPAEAGLVRRPRLHVDDGGTPPPEDEDPEDEDTAQPDDS